MIITDDTIIFEAEDLTLLSQFTKDALSNYFGGSITAHAALSSVLNKEIVSARDFYRVKQAEVLNLSGLDEDIASADSEKQTQIFPLVDQIRTILGS